MNESERDLPRPGGSLDSAREIRLATRNDATEALATLAEATEWSTRFGEPIWPIGSFTLAEQRDLAAAGELVVGFDRGRMSACMRLQHSDDLIWPDDPPGDALYVHKVAVRRAAAGQGWLSAMIGYAIANAREAGVNAVRLDTVPLARMVELYAGLGFETVDPGPRPFNGRMLVRLERRLDDGLSCDQPFRDPSNRRP